jgi:hypothetical protein
MGYKSVSNTGLTIIFQVSKSYLYVFNTYGHVGERIVSLFIRGFSSTEYIMRNLLMIVSHRIAAYRNLRMIVSLTGLLPLSFLFIQKI